MYFKDKENKMHWLDDAKHINLLPEGSIEIADEEAKLYLKKSDQELQAQLNLESLAFLNSTDWYVTRFIESGVEIPDEIKLKRKEARNLIKKESV